MSDILIETLLKITNMAVQGSGGQVLSPPAEPNGFYYLINRVTGEREGIWARPDPRDYQAGDLDSLCLLVKALAPDQASALVAVGHDRIAAVLDERGNRRDRVTVPLTHTPAYLHMLSWQGAAPAEGMAHKQLIQTLRVDFHDQMDDGVLARLQEFQFESGKTVASGQEPGNERLGLDMVQSLKAGGESFPKEVVFRICLFEEFANEPEMLQEIVCITCVDFENQTVRLVPRSGDLAKAQRQTSEEIVKRLCEKLPESVDVVAGVLN